MFTTVSAPSKIILLGEHAVVYGVPALAIPISSLRATIKIYKSESDFIIVSSDANNRDSPIEVTSSEIGNPLIIMTQLVIEHFGVTYPEIRLVIDSKIPIASGLGSGAAISAAVGRAIATAIGKNIDNDLLNQFVFDVEKIHHGTPSGIDNTVIVYERPIIFEKGKPIEPLKIGKPFHIVIANTGITALTRESVADVKRLYQDKPTDIQKIFDDIEALIRQATRHIADGNIKQLGSLMTLNHNLLRKLTVSSDELDNLVNTAISNGALGAKLSGGGRGGNMIALVKESDITQMKRCLLDAGASNVYDTQVV